MNQIAHIIQYNIMHIKYIIIELENKSIKFEKILYKFKYFYKNLE